MGGAGVAAAAVGVFAGPATSARAVDPVTSVNGQTGDVVLGAAAVEALGRTELIRNVMDFGAVGDGSTDDTAAFQAAAAAGGDDAILYIPPGHTYLLAGTVDLLKDSPHTIWAPVGAEIMQTADATTFSARGVFETGTNRRYSTEPPSTSSRTLKLDSLTDLVAGDLVILGSSLSVGDDKVGYLRWITSVDAGNSAVNIDTPPPRDLPAATSFVQRAHPRQAFRFIGGGHLFHQNPETHKASLITVELVENPACDWELGPAGGVGFSVSRCVGGEFTGYVHDLLDGNDHFGYGISLTGATRQFRAAGRARACRHAITTNAGPRLDQLGNYGESEACRFETFAIACSNKAIDTHRTGINHQAIVNVQGGDGGVQIRCDGFTILGGIISNILNGGVNVASGITIPPKLRNLTIDQVYAPNSPINPVTGIQLSSPGSIEGCFISNVSGTGILIQESAGGSTIQNTTINTMRGNGSIGIDIAGTADVHGCTISSAVQSGVRIQSTAAGTTIQGTSIRDVTSSNGSGILMEGAGIVSGCQVSSVAKTGITVGGGGGSVVLSTIVQNGPSNAAVGILLTSSNNQIAASVVRGIYYGVYEGSNQSGNDLDVRVIGSTLNNLQPYTHQGLGRTQQIATSLATGSEIGRVAVEGIKGNTVGYVKVFDA